MSPSLPSRHCPFCRLLSKYLPNNLRATSKENQALVDSHLIHMFLISLQNGVNSISLGKEVEGSRAHHLISFSLHFEALFYLCPLARRLWSYSFPSLQFCWEHSRGTHYHIFRNF